MNSLIWRCDANDSGGTIDEPKYISGKKLGQAYEVTSDTLAQHGQLII